MITGILISLGKLIFRLLLILTVIDVVGLTVYTALIYLVEWIHRRDNNAD